ncbi:hypothetical protein KP004_14865 [Geomonas oryzisoli]|uniref:TIGR03016 family PEP-CTERM system-associated outer membrane protein n=1 Tax=Geomonas oryzisoli TaxID=2847992 RepID=A0ABX8JAA7_9BACT|nr:hypothetical protein [Geomonas oryzisoli]QWV92475.1 hypothetical protein KP004_14865 [Geomonas oryzisoli]
MNVRILLPCFVICLALPRLCGAARNVAVIQQPSLLMFSDVSQAVGVTYVMNQRVTDTTKTTGQSLGERYSLATSLAIFDPKLMLFDISAGASYQNEFGGKGASALDAQYNIVGTGLAASSTPFGVSTSRTTTFIANGYTPSHTITSTSTSVYGRLMHDIVPLQIGYGHGTTTSNGLDVDYSSTTDSMSLSGNYDVDLSSTAFGLSFTSDRSGARDSRSYRASINNSSALDASRSYLLNSLISVNDIKPVDVPNRTINWSESFSARLGKALTASLAFDLSDSSTSDFSGKPQSQTTRSAAASLSHQLFQSLNTTVSGEVSDSRAYGGTSFNYGGGVAVGYNKVLPANSRLGLNFGYTAKMTDQKILLSEIPVLDAPYTVTQLGEHIPLNAQGTVVRIVTVRSLNPDTTYIENVHFRLNVAEGAIEIINIAPGTQILVSYAVAVNPDITYQSTGYTNGFILNLLGNLYTISGNMAVHREKQLNGEVIVPLSKSTTYNLRGDANFGDLKCGVEYASSDNVSHSYSKVRTYASYNTALTTTDVVGLNLGDDFFMYPGGGDAGQGYNENTVSATASYSGLLLQTIRTSASVAATDSRNPFGTTETLATRLGLATVFRKLTCSVDVTNLFRLTDKTSTRDTTVMMRVVRSF